MTYDPEQHNRHSIRLRGRDYAQAGLYYITICSAEKQHIFGEVVQGEMQLSALGEMVRECWHAIPVHFKTVRVRKLVIMPNHLHGILEIMPCEDYYEIRADAERWRAQRLLREPLHIAPLRESQKRLPALADIIRIFKAAATRRAGRQIWQRNYYEHIIRSDKKLTSIMEYIENNPAVWEGVGAQYIAPCWDSI